MERFAVVFREVERLTESDEGVQTVRYSRELSDEAREVAELRRMVAEVSAPVEHRYYSGT